MAGWECHTLSNGLQPVVTNIHAKKYLPQLSDLVEIPPKYSPHFNNTPVGLEVRKVANKPTRLALPKPTKSRSSIEPSTPNSDQTYPKINASFPPEHKPTTRPTIQKTATSNKVHNLPTYDQNVAARTIWSPPEHDDPKCERQQRDQKTWSSGRFVEECYG